MSAVDDPVTTGAPSHPTARPTVIYIAGSGRSGSTLLERMLGALPGFVNVGELIDTFRRVVKFDELCGCGDVFSACEFWVGVGDRAFGGWTPQLVAEATSLQRRVARQRHLAHLVAPRLRGAAFQRDLDRYGEIYTSLYAAILAQSGASVVVDASKGTAQALAVSRKRGSEGTDLRLVHLVRDARGVAFSWAKSGVDRPQGGAVVSTMASFSPQVTAARWIRVQSEITGARRFLAESTVIRYEDLVAAPAAEIIRSMSEIGLPVDCSTLQHIDGRTVDLPPSHGLSGNPSRFRSGHQELRIDEQWRRDMAPWDRFSTTVIAAAPLGRYHYLGARRLRSSSARGAPITSGNGSTALAPGQQFPPVTVVVPTRGRRDLVRLAVAGIVAQRYDGHIRCLVVHDQEERDVSLEEMSRPGRRVEVITNDGHPGLAGSRNTGVAKSETDLIASCDDDDSWLPDKLSCQVRLLAAHPEMLVVGAGIRLVMAPDHIVEWLGSSDLVSQADLIRSRRKELHSSTLLMHRRAFDLAGGYDEQLPHSFGEDWEWLLRVSRFGSIGVVRQPLANIKKDGQSWFRERSENVAEALQYVLCIHPEIERSRRGHARLLGQIAFAKASLGQRREALTWVGRSLSRWPFAPQAGLALVQVTSGATPQRLLRYARMVGRGLS